METIAQAPAAERAELFNETAARRGLAPPIVEKDFWVCWTLGRLFAASDRRPGLIFKGGTSLSKVYRAIERFSEDIDLAFDRHDLGFADDRDPMQASSGKQAQRLLDELSEATIRHVAERFVPDLEALLAEALGPAGPATWSVTIDPADPQTVEFVYPSSLAAGTYDALAYVRPTVRLELGARTEHWPSEEAQIEPYAAEAFPDLFVSASVTVRALAIERTFWEKATILHAEAHRPADKPAPIRLSRHYYDLAMLAAGPYAERCLARIDLLEAVARHKARFFRSSWAAYDTARPGSLRLSPASARLPKLRADYRQMGDMIFGDPPHLDTALETLARLEKRINRL